MANEKQIKESLQLTVTFERKIFKGEDGRESKYVQCTAEYQGEAFRFGVKDKDARLFQYLMKQNGYVLHDTAGNVVAEE